MLTATTAFFTFYVTFVFSMPIYVMAGVFFMTLLVLIFLLHLRRTQPFQFLVISQELPRLPLVLTILILFISIGLTHFAMICEAALLVTGVQVELFAQFIEQHFDQPGNTNDTNKTNDTNDIDIIVPTPMEHTVEPVTQSGSSRGIRGFFWQYARGYVDNIVYHAIEASTTEIEKEVYKTIYEGVVTKNTPWVYTPESLNVNLGSSAFSAHPVLFEEGDKIKECTALCFSTPEAARVATTLVPQLKPLVASAVNNSVLYDSGCILAECKTGGDLKLITDRITFPLVEQLSIPPSPPDHDLQSVNPFR